MGAASSDAPAPAPVAPPKTTPMMQQYLQAKSLHPDALLLFRMGDFYETFYEDAKLAARVLDLTLTSRDKERGEGAVPMAGVPHHAADGYIARLVAAGYKVAICDQVEDPRLAKGLVKREVTRVITPGMVLDPQSLPAQEPNYLAALAPPVESDGLLGLGLLDFLTGEFKLTCCEGLTTALDELARCRPRELLVPVGDWPALSSGLSRLGLSPAITSRPAAFFDPQAALDALRQRFAPADLAPLTSGDHGAPARAAAAGALQAYAAETQKALPPHVQAPRVYVLADHLVLDEVSRRNLELTRTSFEGGRKGSLLWHLDRCSTAMGSRLLQQWLLYPLRERAAIEARLDLVAALVAAPALRRALREHFAAMRDIERLNGRLAAGHDTPRDLVALGGSCARLRPLRALLAADELAEPLRAEAAALDDLAPAVEAIGAALAEEAPLAATDPGAFKPGHDAELDRLVALASDSKAVIAQLQERERQATGIGSLKIRFNQVFGYYIEVTHANLRHTLPERYIRRQTMANAERFVTEELKALEEQILGAEGQRQARQAVLYGELRARLLPHVGAIARAAAQVARLDVLVSLADVAEEQHYTRPATSEEDRIEIRAGRHPVLERLASGLGERFVPNDLVLDGREQQLLIVTGPNMAGKSTVMRQVALITLLAQVGSFVPAEAATIGLRDRIFTRVGASDILHRGQSTFMVEMTETAAILQQATRRSLVILDEIGRGTSTFDGLSIAWAVAEYIHDRCGSLTLFATHYHELTDLVHELPRVRNVTIQVREWNDQIIFLRTLAAGGASRSYGIQVARLAGLPRAVLERAREVLANLEADELDREQHPRLARSAAGPRRPAGPRQLALFAGEPAPSLLEQELRALDIERLTPLEALTALAALKARLG